MSTSLQLPADWGALAPGTVLPELALEVSRRQLVMFAGAVDDYEPLHYDHLFVTAQGYDGVIAHGWLTGALMCRVAAQWPPLREARFSEIEIHYRRPNLPGPSRYGGEVVRKHINEEGCHIELALWGANPTGERIVQGSVTAILGGDGT